MLSDANEGADAGASGAAGVKSIQRGVIFNIQYM
jgi:hypothetical protein